MLTAVHRENTCGQPPKFAVCTACGFSVEQRSLWNIIGNWIEPVDNTDFAGESTAEDPTRRENVRHTGYATYYLAGRS